MNHPIYTGLHLSGSNSFRTSLAILAGSPNSPPKVVKLYEKIGSFDITFSDERLVNILSKLEISNPVFIDCPMTLPPCVSCSRAVCPGIIGCEDISVAWMLKLAQTYQSARKRKRKPINPQNQRLADMLFDSNAMGEATFNVNNSALAFRARALNKRLKSLPHTICLYETSIIHVLKVLASHFDLPSEYVKNYRNFERGLLIRKKWLMVFCELKWIDRDSIEKYPILNQLENFQAFICALISYLYSQKKLNVPPADYMAELGWIYVPNL